MNREQAIRLLHKLPLDSTEIIIKGHDTQEVFFSSDADCQSIGAQPAQRGSYKGTKRRWRIEDNLIPSPQPQLEGRRIDPQEIPQAPEPVFDESGFTPINIDDIKFEE